VPSTRSKKVSRAVGKRRAQAGRRSRRHKELVRRRGQDRQKNKINRRSARRDSRPSAPSDQRTASTYIFRAICPKERKAVGLILPWCNTAMMNLHLAAIAADVASGRHAVLLLDQAGWHLSGKRARCRTTCPAATEVPRGEPARERLAIHPDHCCDAGTSWKLSPRPSGPSDRAIGHISSDQSALV
jgi:hypothetical protein